MHFRFTVLSEITQNVNMYFAVVGKHIQDRQKCLQFVSIWVHIVSVKLIKILFFQQPIPTQLEYLCYTPSL